VTFDRWRKASEREAKKAKKSNTRKQSDKSISNTVSKRQNVTDNNDSEEEGLQHHKISQYECAACFGHWEKDGAEEWLRCTNNTCGVWGHADCLDRSDLWALSNFLHLGNI